MRFSRRQFLNGILAFPLARLRLDGRKRPFLSSRPRAPSAIRSARWVQTTPDFQAGEKSALAALPGKESALALAAEAQDGAYLSPVFRADFPFNALSLIWQADVPGASTLSLALRTSADGLIWSEWLDVVETADLPKQTGERYGELVIARGSYIQWRARFHGISGASPSLRTVAAVYIDSTAGPAAADATVQAFAGAEPLAVTYPTIISRAGWGCPEPYSSTWPPDYRRVAKIIVHHTATSNDYADGAEVVRAVWQYHAVEQGWGDIGYNYLIDRQGKIYEGRFGGDDVIGGHASCYNPASSGIGLIGNFEFSGVSPAAQDALVRLMAWLAHRRDIHPLGDSFFVDRVVANSCGHRDLNNNPNIYSGLSCHMVTACPGANLYSLLPTLRSQTWALFPSYADAWVGHSTPSTLGMGQTTQVSVSIINKGTLIWPARGTYPVRLGYKWYRSDGSQYVQTPADDQRTYLPADTAFGQRVDLRGYLTAPRAAGSYTLKWDMVREGITWFEWQGAQTLSISVNVLGPALSVSAATLYFLVDAVKNPSPQIITIQNATMGPLRWTASSNQTWCMLSAPGGDAPHNLIVSIDKGTLSAGATHQATITINGLDGASNSPQNISVTFVYSATPLKKRFLPATWKG